MEIRKMKKEEKREVKKIAVKAFSFFEGLFIGTPKEAIVAVIDNKIVGGITYKNIDNSIYIDFAFVDPKHQGKNIGKELYRETFKQLNTPIMTALVKDDNVASFKSF